MIKKLLFLALLFVGFIGLIGSVSAQTPEETAKKYNVTFPISQLGGCANLASCRTYCEDPVNHDACIAFAKARGFYKEDAVQTQKREILQQAQTELGCNSYESCQAFCQKEANFENCHNFARNHGLGGGYAEDPQKTEILAKAKEVLRCDSYESCKAFCSQDINRQKCSDFAQQVGLRGGEEHKGPGGCTSEVTCRAFCSDPTNYKICSGYAGSSGARFSGPGGCNSEESCRTYCQSHPNECAHIGGGTEGVPTPSYDPQEMCNKTPNCKWTGTTCQCGGQTFTPYPYQTPSGAIDPATYCNKTPGCSWTGTTCQCSGSAYTPYPSASSSPSNTSPAPTYQTQQYSTDPATACNQTPGCSWTGTTCQCSSVHGASTSEGLLQTIIRLLFGR